MFGIEKLDYIPLFMSDICNKTTCFLKPFYRQKLQCWRDLQKLFYQGMLKQKEKKTAQWGQY